MNNSEKWENRLIQLRDTSKQKIETISEPIRYIKTIDIQAYFGSIDDAIQLLFKNFIKNQRRKNNER